MAWRIKKGNKKDSVTGNRTPVSRVTGGDTYHYTITDRHEEQQILRYKRLTASWFISSRTSWMPSWHSISSSSHKRIFSSVSVIRSTSPAIWWSFTRDNLTLSLFTGTGFPCHTTSVRPADVSLVWTRTSCKEIRAKMSGQAWHYNLIAYLHRSWMTAYPSLWHRFWVSSARWCPTACPQYCRHSIEYWERSPPLSAGTILSALPSLHCLTAGRLSWEIHIATSNRNKTDRQLTSMYKMKVHVKSCATVFSSYYA